MDFLLNIIDTKSCTQIENLQPRLLLTFEKRNITIGIMGQIPLFEHILGISKNV